MKKIIGAVLLLVLFFALGCVRAEGKTTTLLVYMCFNWLFASADNLDPLALRPNTWLPMLPFLSLFFLHLLSSSHPSPFSLFLSLFNTCISSVILLSSSLE